MSPEGTIVPGELSHHFENYLSYSLLKAASEQAGKPISLLHFDTHLDTGNTYFDEPFTHGTPFRRAHEG